MTESNGNNKPKQIIPDWAGNPFREFVDRFESLEELLDLSIRGIKRLGSMHELHEILNDGRNASEKDIMQMELAKKDSSLAEREITQGFPLLHEQAVVILWGGLESSILDFASAWLLHTPDAYKIDSMSKLKVKIGEYEGLSHKEKATYLISLLIKEISGPLSAGTSQFDRLLSTLGINYIVPPDTTRTMIEMQSVRNIIVHNKCVADKRFVITCPWLNKSIGEYLPITHVQYGLYRKATHEYVVCILNSLTRHFKAIGLT